MLSATIAALAALRAKRVALITPYIEALASQMVGALQYAGFAVVAHETMGLSHDSLADKVSTATIRDWALAVDRKAAEVVVIGCSSLRASGPGFIDELEQALGKPVVTSTQAFIWHMLRTAEIDDQIDGYGKLLAVC